MFRMLDFENNERGELRRSQMNETLKRAIGCARHIMSERGEFGKISGMMGMVHQRFVAAGDQEVQSRAWRSGFAVGVLRELLAMLPKEDTPRREASAPGTKRRIAEVSEPSGSAAASSSARSSGAAAPSGGGYPGPVLAAVELREEQRSVSWRGGENFSHRVRSSGFRAGFVEHAQAGRGRKVGGRRIGAEEAALAQWKMDEAVVLIRVFHTVVKPFAMERVEWNWKENAPYKTVESWETFRLRYNTYIFGLMMEHNAFRYLDGAGHFADVAAVESIVTVMLQEAAKPGGGKFNWRGFWLDWDEWSDAHREIVGAFFCGTEFFEDAPVLEDAPML